MFDDKMLQEIVSASLPKGEKTLDEAYVAQAKRYPLVTELLSTMSKEAHLKAYETFVDRLSKTSMKVDTAAKQEANSLSSAYRELKQDEAYLHNAVYLHELFFANCFDPSSEIFMDTLAFMRLQRDFGTFETWQSDFLACAQSARDGWVICGYSIFLRRFVNTFVDSDSTGVMMGVIPMIVVDVHEHAYYRDYLDDRKSYVIGMMQELNWDVIEGRFNKAETINEALK
jgi:Fe-Mn family superoxide dismutase